jgi:hypothetical protein
MWPAARRYSDELKELVTNCLAFFPEGRHTPRQVLNAVNEHLKANPDLHIDMANPTGTLLTFPDCNDAEMGER